MMQTPVKTFKQVLLSDFQCTRNMSRQNTLQKKIEEESVECFPTPKRNIIFLPLKDRRLRKYEFKFIKNNRARLMDWFLQIFQTYRIGWQCFWMAVQLLDSLIADFQYVTLKNIHLVGMVCCFITAKLLGKNCLSLRHVVVGLGHYKFNEREIIIEQQKILKLIFENSNFERNNVYSYLMEKYHQFPESKLGQAMKMITLAMMRPDIAFDEMRVNTYKELVEQVMIQVSYNRGIKVLSMIQYEMRDKLGSINVQKYAHLMLLK